MPRLVAAMNQKSAVRVTEISRTGLRIETEEPVYPGKLCFLEIDHQGQIVDLLVEVKWAEPREDAASCAVGAAFVDVFGEDRGGLWRHLGTAAVTQN